LKKLYKGDKMKTQLQICNNKLGWIPSFSKIIDGKEYALFDAIYTEDKQQMFDLKKQITPCRGRMIIVTNLKVGHLYDNNRQPASR